MPRRKPRLARPILAVALAGSFLVLATSISSLHTCYPPGREGPSWQRPGAFAPAGATEAAERTPASRQDRGRTNGLKREEACLACLFGAQLRALLLPADAGTAVVAESQPMPRQPEGIPALSRTSDIPLPRAPPPTTHS